MSPNIGDIRRSAFGWDRASRSHGLRPRQGAAFVGRAAEL